MSGEMTRVVTSNIWTIDMLSEIRNLYYVRLKSELFKQIIKKNEVNANEITEMWTFGKISKLKINYIYL